MPEAHADRVRALLPALLVAGAAPPGDATPASPVGLPAVRFLVPLLSQVCVIPVSNSLRYTDGWACCSSAQHTSHRQS